MGHWDSICNSCDVLFQISQIVQLIWSKRWSSPPICWCSSSVELTSDLRDRQAKQLSVRCGRERTRGQPADHSYIYNWNTWITITISKSKHLKGRFGGTCSSVTFFLSVTFFNHPHTSGWHQVSQPNSGPSTMALSDLLILTEIWYCIEF